AFDLTQNLFGSEFARFEIEISVTNTGISREPANGVACASHIQLARGIGVQNAVFDDDLAAGWQTFAIERRRAVASDDRSIIDHIDGLSRHLFAEFPGEEGGSAIDAVAIGCVENGTNERASNLRCKHDGHAL